ncbi:Hsp70 family protein [Actinoplanes sp. ATCC 53533]|uniref:Hsp70 family protein n=1 Tax=Actinoplanes sp. ATCC 53533 TaxID=1288362 RepID=UPI000F77B9DF|nr:Hsp70 family protein [Actinoplanes sp. ATCC 53533]RSM64511.1 Hsp70 family protein [Actinoplanes sp. ATCC 53533]
MYALGIDLGTTYTAAAVWRDGRAEIAPLGSHSAAIPSVVLLRADETFLTGDSANRRGLSEPNRVAREFKRRLGDSVPILLGGVPYSAEALMARMLRTAVDEVVSREGGEPASICVSRPANWGPYKMDLMHQAVRLAGIDQPVHFTTEPEAAAVFYAHQQRLEPGAVVAVYDLGGGTFDAAVLRKTSSGFDLIGAPEGIERLGGIDFDAAIFGHVAAAIGDKLAELDEDDPAVIAAVARLREECVQAKEALSADTDAAIPVMLPNINTEIRLTRAELEAMLRPALHGSIEALRRAVRSAGVEPQDLHSVLLVGGSSRIPLVAQLVGSELGRPVAVDAHPKHAVALGAAWQASTAITGLGSAQAEPGPAAARSATAVVVPEPTAAMPTFSSPGASAAPETAVRNWPPTGYGAAAVPGIPKSHDADSTGQMPTTPSTADKGARRRGPLLAAAAVVVVLLTGGGTAWALVGSNGQEKPGGQGTDITAAAAGQPQKEQQAGAAPTAGEVPPDEDCTELKKSTRWVCITKATVQDGKFTVWFDAEWNGSKPNISNGFHLHLYGGDGTRPDEDLMGSQATSHGTYYFEDQQPSVRRTSDEDFEAVADAEKICARIAKNGHQLAKANDGSYHTGNCFPIQRY